MHPEIEKFWSGEDVWFSTMENPVDLYKVGSDMNIPLVLPTKPEIAIHGELYKLGVKFESEHLINKKFCVDVFVPDYNLIIFVDGCYWHACPTHHPNNKKPNSDNARIPYLTKCGFNVEIIWEHDIKDCLDEVIKSLCQKYNIQN